MSRSSTASGVSRYVFSMTLAFTLSGCGGPDYHDVAGKVTLDGQPLPDASITFMPESEEGTAAVGRTDSAGNYRLGRGAERFGTTVGQYRVRITTYQAGNDQDHPPIPPVPERVPAKYNIRSDLTAEVVPEENVIDYELDSQGKIVQPRRF